MDKGLIRSKLFENHTLFINFISSLTDNDLQKSINNKWNAYQQLEHVYLCLRPVVLAFKLPLFIPALIFGTTKNGSRDYDTLVNLYSTGLQRGFKAPYLYTPEKKRSHFKKDKLIKKLNRLVFTLNELIENLKESDLDAILLPHPLLGKITMREMLYFAIYHVKHHHAQSENNLIT